MRIEGSLWTVLSVVLMLFAVGGANAQSSYMGVYLDEERTTWCASGEGVYQIDIWIYAYVEEKGILSFGYDISLPPNLDLVSWYSNPHVLLELCDPKFGCPPGEAGGFDECLAGWTWIKHGVFNVLSAEPGVVEIVAHPTSGTIALEGCLGSIYYPTVISSVYVNYDASAPECQGPVPVERSTWGAIKTLYQDG
jgi:hypothetical protein